MIGSVDHFQEGESFSFSFTFSIVSLPSTSSHMVNGAGLKGKHVLNATVSQIDGDRDVAGGCRKLCRVDVAAGVVPNHCAYCR